MRRTVVLLVLLVVAALYGVWHHETCLPIRSEADPPQTLIVEPGSGVRAIGRQLHGMGLVRHPEVFRLLVLLRGATRALRAGEYSLEGSLSLEQIVDKLVRGDIVRHKVTFPEGSDIEEMATIARTLGMAPAVFLAAAQDVSPIRDLDPEAADLEGYLFPDTYEIDRRPDAATLLVRRMVQRFRDVMLPEMPLMGEIGLSLRDVVILASLVERETALAEERPRIAAVFLNRLGKRMPLQTDPTVIYALKRAGRYDGNIRKVDLDIDSPYNTYRHAGLPPGPIASPGREALRAVLRPAAVKDLYFVSRNDGSHHFSETLAEHERAVSRYQRGGSSRVGRQVGAR